MIRAEFPGASPNRVHPHQRSAWSSAWPGTLRLAVALSLACFELAHAQAPPPPKVTVSVPLQRIVSEYGQFTGQFSAVNVVEIRSRVGGYLTEQLFVDGQRVAKGDRLFTIDQRPFEIALAKAQAQAITAEAQLVQTTRDVARGNALRSQDNIAASVQDQRVTQMKAATAAVATSRAEIRSAELDLEFSRITAPVSGVIGARQVSLGNLVTGGTGSSSPTLLATIVSIDPIWFNFDMSEADFAAYKQAVADKGLPTPQSGELGADVQLSGQRGWARHGRVEFIDNQVDRSSGTIRVRATFANADGFLTPGQFGRLRMPLSPPRPTMLLPDAAVTTDQSRKIVLTVSADGHVVPKPVEVGPIVDGLRIIRSGLDATDQVIVDGIVRARPGSVVSPVPGEIKATGS